MATGDGVSGREARSGAWCFWIGPLAPPPDRHEVLLDRVPIRLHKLDHILSRIGVLGRGQDRGEEDGNEAGLH